MALFDWLSSTERSPRLLNSNWHHIQVRIQSDPYYRLRSQDEIVVAAALGIKIDVNQASVDDWLRLPGLSIHQARSLVELTNLGVQFYCTEDIAAALGVPAQRLSPLKPILSFCYYDGELSCTLINPNTASVEQLAQIPLVDMPLARAIMRDRLEAGPYRHLADFQRRLSLAPKLISQLMHYLRF
ncbi:MAG: ComEA family DNA-binding protein [Kastovskya adunca ATA6-11-RM4]|jgi:DNA uptake protein ComE-like DNA-binding protein|nr:ComEA family DNA-binding protein [Kastovskya adunca ATA6-11-RM4]